MLQSTTPSECSACGITLDITKQNLSTCEFRDLIELASSVDIIEQYRAMRMGAIVNRSEGRAALHTSLRDCRTSSPYYEDVQRILCRMYDFSDAIRSGKFLGSTNEKITDVINIGIGGSDIGVKTVWCALRPLKPAIRLHFLSAADGVNFERITSNLNPYTTLTVVSSKSFKTVETLSNARAVMRWLEGAGISAKHFSRHICVTSANVNAPNELNLPDENFFQFWDWVGGRFSVWSSVGLPLVICLGKEVFKEFLIGAYAMDSHAEETSIDNNLPALLSLLAYRNIIKRKMLSYCMLPYDERLRGLVPWLQQLEMESLGKMPVHNESTGARVWGGHGNESQHSFYQWLRTGTGSTAIDVCWCDKPGHRQDDLHRLLINSAKAQVEALSVRENTNYINGISTVRIDELSPARLGALMAMYEHKTTMLGALFGINPFDQPAVEYGKKLTKMFQSNKI